MDAAVLARLAAAEAQLESYRRLYLEMERLLRKLEQQVRELRSGA